MPSSATLPRRKRLRALFALVFAPAITALVLTFLFALITWASTRTYPPLQQFMYVTLGLGAAMLALSLTFGLGFHAIAFRMRWRSIVTYIKAGAAFGCIGGLLLIGFVILVSEASQTVREAGFYFGAGLATLLLGVLPGALTATIFWWIRRPDRDIDRGLDAAFA